MRKTNSNPHSRTESNPILTCPNLIWQMQNRYNNYPFILYLTHAAILDSLFLMKTNETIILTLEDISHLITLHKNEHLYLRSNHAVRSICNGKWSILSKWGEGSLAMKCSTAFLKCQASIRMRSRLTLSTRHITSAFDMAASPPHVFIFPMSSLS